MRDEERGGREGERESSLRKGEDLLGSRRETTALG